MHWAPLTCFNYVTHSSYNINPESHWQPQKGWCPTSNESSEHCAKSFPEQAHLASNCAGIRTYPNIWNVCLCACVCVAMQADDSQRQNSYVCGRGPISLRCKRCFSLIWFWPSPEETFLSWVEHNSSTQLKAKTYPKCLTSYPEQANIGHSDHIRSLCAPWKWSFDFARLCICKSVLRTSLFYCSAVAFHCDHAKHFHFHVSTALHAHSPIRYKWKLFKYSITYKHPPPQGPKANHEDSPVYRPEKSMTSLRFNFTRLFFSTVKSNRCQRVGGILNLENFELLSSLSVPRANGS